MKYNWSKDTINHFRFESMRERRKEIEKRIREFVETECYIVPPASEDDLVDDLMEQVYKSLDLI